MQLHHGRASCAAAGQTNRHVQHPRVRRAPSAWLWIACLIVAACGDDGTDGLSSCPEGKIESDKTGVLHCADLERAKASAGKAGSAPKAGAGADKNTSANMQANTAKPESSPSSSGKPASEGTAADKPAAMSGEASKPPSEPGAKPASGGEAGQPANAAAAPQAGAAAAMSGGSNPPSVPSGPWSCVQYMDACSCVPHEGLGDGCTKPHPTCCTLVLMNGAAVGCVCVPPGSAQCDGMKADPANYPSVAKCPPN